MIDAHHHLWKLSRGDYGWIGAGRDPALAPIERDYLLGDFAALAAAQGIRGSVAVQAAQSVAETRWLLAQAHASRGLIQGVVGWVDLAAADAPDVLAELGSDPLLRGIRPMLQEIADVDWILQPRLAPALQAIMTLDLSFDLLVRPPYLKAALALLERHPGLRAVIDHAAKPDIAGGMWEPWAQDMRRIARSTGVFCKLSGLATEARPGWNTPDLRRYVEHLIDCFGAERLLWGSDWPVLLLNGTYPGWLASARELIASLPAAQQAAILGDNAMRFYRLAPRTP